MELTKRIVPTVTNESIEQELEGLKISIQEDEERLDRLASEFLGYITHTVDLIDEAKTAYQKRDAIGFLEHKLAEYRKELDNLEDSLDYSNTRYSTLLWVFT